MYPEYHRQGNGEAASAVFAIVITIFVMAVIFAFCIILASKHQQSVNNDTCQLGYMSAVPPDGIEPTRNFTDLVMAIDNHRDVEGLLKLCERDSECIANSARYFVPTKWRTDEEVSKIISKPGECMSSTTAQIWATVLVQIREKIKSDTGNK